MKTKIINYLGISVLLITLLLNVNVISGTNSKNYLKLSTISETWAQVSGTSSVSGSGSGSGATSCWTSTYVQCPPTGTQTTTSGSSHTGGGWYVSGSISGNHTGSGNTGGGGITIGYSGPRNSTSSTTTTTTTTKYRTDCTSGGTQSCQQVNCEGQSVGPALVCKT
jgi:hypothetical protein